jgi:hypothetical protein
MFRLLQEGRFSAPACDAQQRGVPLSIQHLDAGLCSCDPQGGSFDSSNGDSIRSNGRGRTTNLRNVLLDYVARADPSEVQDFLQAASNSPAVIAAMKQTVSNMVGTLPPAHFQVTIDTVSGSAPMSALPCGAPTRT